MISEDTYRKLCDRLIAYINSGFDNVELVLYNTQDGQYTVRAKCLRPNVYVESSLVFHRPTYALIYYELVSSPRCFFSKENISLEEVDLQLQIRGY